MVGAMSHGRDKVYGAYEDAKATVGDTYMSAKESMTDQAKEKYEAAKERVSQATGDLGDEMRKTRTEL
ncbi:hypothetical protein ACSBR2_024809 [Camellia fascicularis]